MTQALRNPGSIFYDANELAEHINIRQQAKPCMTFFCTGRSTQDLNDSLEMKIYKTMGTKTLFNIGDQRIRSREKILNRISNEQNAPYF